MDYKKLFETDLKAKKVIYRGINSYIEKQLDILSNYNVNSKEEFQKYENLVNQIIKWGKPIDDNK